MLMSPVAISACMCGQEVEKGEQRGLSKAAKKWAVDSEHAVSKGGSSHPCTKSHHLKYIRGYFSLHS
jgi:hypothetical protein